MRPLLIIALLFFINSSFGQKQCSCDSNQFLKEIISCDPVIFKNDAKLFTQYNCDSSWLTFQNKKGKKTIIYTLESLVELTGRLGYSYATEYKSGIKTTVELTEEMIPEHLIDESKIIGNKLILKYRFKTKAENDEWLIGEIIIDLNKYGS